MKQHGFTIIELVTVIALLGVLSAIALPRFIEVSDNAEGAVSNATLGSFTTSLSLARGAWLAKGANLSAVTMDGTTYEYSAQGWPTGSTLTSAGCSELWRDLMQSAPSIEEYVAPSTVVASDWVSFGNANLCVFINSQDSSINFTTDPYIIYYFTTIGTLSAGTVTPVNFP